MCNKHLPAAARFATIAVAFLGLFCLAGCKKEQARATRSQLRANGISVVPQNDFASRVRKIYPYSVVPGGVHSVREFETLPDSIARVHYAGLHPIRIVENNSEKLMYVSFRRKNSVFWTRKRLRVPRGELLVQLTGRDDVAFARTRCGNLLSAVPQTPVLPEPQESALETALDDSAPLVQTAGLHLSELFTPEDLVPINGPTEDMLSLERQPNASDPKSADALLATADLPSSPLSEGMMSPGPFLGSPAASGTGGNPTAIPGVVRTKSAVPQIRPVLPSGIPGSSVTVTPEPSSLALLVGAVCFGYCLLRRSQRLR